MRRIIHLQSTEHVIDGSYILCVMVTKENLNDWCLALSMLLLDVIDLLTVAEPHGKPYLDIRLDKRYSPSDRGAAQVDTGPLRLSIGEHELRYWMTYYLGYLRDGLVGANHIDCDVPLDANDASKRLYLSLQAADVAPPLTPEEARRLLDMN